MKSKIIYVRKVEKNGIAYEVVDGTTEVEYGNKNDKNRKQTIVMAPKPMVRLDRKKEEERQKIMQSLRDYYEKNRKKILERKKELKRNFDQNVLQTYLNNKAQKNDLKSQLQKQKDKQRCPKPYKSAPWEMD